MSDEEGPPTTRRYPETPMPTHEEPERDEEEVPTTISFWNNSILLLFVAITIGHFWTVMALQSDVNIIKVYQQEHVGQYKHIVDLLENMQQVKWQMVPSS
tara:strand:+ start:23047 stop:23346 length:300 start_codon:yes stop_codon:yes gene_type:complete